MCIWPIWGWIDVEGKRILGSKAFLAVLAALVVLNCFSFYQRSDTQENPRIDGELYHRQMMKVSGYSWEQAVAVCETDLLSLEEAYLAGHLTRESELYEQIKATQQVQKQYEYLISYEKYLDKIQYDAKLMQTVSLFADPDSKGYKNITKTAGDFAAMEGVSLREGHDLAVTSFFGDKWTDYSIIIVICVICALFVAERKEGLWPMIYAASGGRWRLALKRVGLLLAAAWIGAIVIVGSKILLCGWEYHGLGEWDRILQSVPMFQNVPVPMTVGQFWMLYIAVKAMGAFWLGLVLWTILSAISNLGLALCAGGLLMGAEFAFTAIPSSSIFAMLRYVNVFSYVDFITVFTRYLNLSVFGRLISGSDLVLAILLPLCIVFAVVVVAVSEWKHPVSAENRLLSWMDLIRKKTDPILAGGGEPRKLLIKRRGILLMILLVPAVHDMQAPPREYAAYDPYIQYYEEKYIGPITEEKLQTMEEDMQTNPDEIAREGLRLVIDDAKAAFAHGGDAQIVPTAPYDAAWNNNIDNYSRTTALMALLFLVLILAPIASQERQNNMVVLLQSTSGGRKALMWRKQILLLLVAGFVWAAVYGTEVLRIIENDGNFLCLDAPGYSLRLFRDFGWGLPLGVLLSLYYAAKLVVLAVVGETCFFLSSRCGKNRDAILLCCGVILIPAALAVVGSVVGEYLSFLLPLGGAELLQ